MCTLLACSANVTYELACSIAIYTKTPIGQGFHCGPAACQPGAMAVSDLFSGWAAFAPLEATFRRCTSDLSSSSKIRRQTLLLSNLNRDSSSSSRSTGSTTAGAGASRPMSSSSSCSSRITKSLSAEVSPRLSSMTTSALCKRRRLTSASEPWIQTRETHTTSPERSADNSLRTSTTLSSDFNASEPSCSQSHKSHVARHHLNESFSFFVSPIASSLVVGAGAKMDETS